MVGHDASEVRGDDARAELGATQVEIRNSGIARRSVLAGFGLTVAAATVTRAVAADATSVPETSPVGTLELAVAAKAPTSPTGVTLSRDGRMFVFMPRFDDKTVFSVGEVAPDGTVSPFPDAAMNRPDARRPLDTLFHIPNGVFDAENGLWLLDAGLMAAAGAPVQGAPKLVRLDIATRRVVATIPLGTGVEPTSSLNDLRLDAKRNAMFISDQGQEGQGAILAVDLATGRVVRRLARHPSTASVKHILKIVEGRPVMKRRSDGRTSEVQGGANGLALSPDGERVYYAPLMSRQLYAVDAAALLDPDATEAAVAVTVEDLGEKGLTGGLIADDRDRVYLALQEFNAVGRRDPDGTIEILATDPRLIWADTFWITPDRWLYISSSQVNRRAEFNGGVDYVQPPFAMLRMRIDAGPA